MPRYSSYPTLIDDLKNIDTKDLKKWGYLNSSMTGTITWSRHGVKTASIDITTVIDNRPRLILNYQVNGEPINYDVPFVEVASNLGKGSYFMFLCPFTFKRCRKLHLINGKFMHRSALRHAMYDCQTQSKSYRSIKGIFEPYVLQDKYYEELHKPYFKSHYKGKPTKRYIYLVNKLQLADQMSLERYQNILMFGK